MKQKQHLGVSIHPRVCGFASKNIYKESITFVLATFIGYMYIYAKNDLASRQLFNELKVREDVLGEDDIPPNIIEACEVFATCLLKNDLYV